MIHLETRHKERNYNNIVMVTNAILVKMVSCQLNNCPRFPHNLIIEGEERRLVGPYQYNALVGRLTCLLKDVSVK